MAGLPVLLVVDEPCLAIASTMPGGAGPAIDTVASVLGHTRASGARAGLHCCARVPPALLCYPEPDVISFDASTQLELVLASAAVRSFLERDGWLSAGLVPTTRVVSRGIAGTLFARSLMAASRSADVPRLARQTIVAATCGLGLVPAAAAKAPFRPQDTSAPAFGGSRLIDLLDNILWSMHNHTTTYCALVALRSGAWEEGTRCESGAAPPL